MKSGIIGYGTKIPWLRIKVEEIARVWDKDGAHISKGINVKEKSVAAIDEDSCTLSVEAARKGLRDFNIDAKRINAIFIGSESHPYAVNPTSSIVGDALGCTPYYFAADLEFACKAGTAGMQICLGMCESGMIDVGLAVGADTAQGKPNDALEFTAGSGAGAIFIGRNPKEIIGEVEHTVSFTTDTPDFWRRPEQEFPEHGGRFTGEPAYFRHVLGAANKLFEDTGQTAKDFDFAVFHQPNGKFPLKVGKMLGFEIGQLEQGLITPFIGNTYSGATPIGLCSILDVAEPDQKILVVSYGSGAGSDAFSIKVTKNILERRAKKPVLEKIKTKKYVDYATYAKHRRKLKSL